MNRQNKQGFTLVELMLSAALFSFVLMFVIVGFVQINRAYNKGITVRRMHQNARKVIDDLSRAIVDSKKDALRMGAASRGGFLCIKNERQYRWVEGYVDRSDNHNYSIVKYDPEIPSQACNVVDEKIPEHSSDKIYDNLTDPLVAASDIEIAPAPGAPVGTYKIVVEFSTNQDSGNFGNDLEPCDVQDPYCDHVRLETTVSVRR